MIRKSTLVAVPAIAFALTLFANVDSASQAFAKGGMGGPKGKPGMGRMHGDNWRNGFRYNRNWDRFGFGYPCFGVEAPVCGCEVVTQPVLVQPVVEPVVQPVAVATPVCTTCEPVATVGFGYDRYFGYRHDRREFRRGGERPLEHGGRMGHK
jgi:hypothetical protein